MDIPAFLFCLSPVFFLMFFAVCFKQSALSLSFWGTLFSAVLVIVYFKTPVVVVLDAALDGICTTLPLLLVVFAGILLSSLLTATGSLQRIADWIMHMVRDSFHRGTLITLGVGNFMEGASVIAEPVIAPMLRASGVSPQGSAALSIIGYAGLMTLEMAGIIITVLSLVTGLPIRELGICSAWLSIPATLCMALCVPFVLPRAFGGARRIPLAVCCGIILGFVTLGATAFIGVSVAGMIGGCAVIFVLFLLGPRKLPANRTIACDLLPFVFMLVALLLVNTVPLLKELTYNRLTLAITIVPVHTITLRPFFSAYLYLFAAFFLAVFLLRVPLPQVGRILASGMSKGWRASVAMGLFGAMGQIIAYSGYGARFLQLQYNNNIPWILANGLQTYTGGIYPVFVPLLGWVGTFITGYGVASLMLFGLLQVQSAQLLGVSAPWLAAGLAVGASLGSVSSPFKIAIAAPMCDAQGREGNILRWTIPLGIAASLVIGLILRLVLL